MSRYSNDVKTQALFFDALFNGEDLGDANIYRELIAIRYFEVLESCFKRSKIALGSRWSELVYEFINEGSRALQIWKMPDEFRKFVTKKERNPPYLKELMWFEWIEIESALSKRAKNIDRKFSWNRGVKATPSLFLKSLKYTVYEENITKKRGWILFFTNRDGETYWILTSKYIFEILKSLKSKKSLEHSYKKVSKKWRIYNKESKKIAGKILKNYFDLGILY